KVRIRVSYASSGILARQIENGAPANLYLSAAIEWTQRLLKQRLLVDLGNNTFLGNRLVLCVPKQEVFELKIERGFALLNSLRGGHLAIGDPLHVPAGKYARAALRSLGVWKNIEKSTARTTDVRNALALIEMGEVAAGIVYRSDAIASQKVQIIDIFPLTSHPPIRYTLNIVKENDKPAVRHFYKFLESEISKTIFMRYGFEVK
ncbi:MAG: molybdate ABC transporter substrate-binding protein, partial [Pseudomonadota bacterium]|nr:molybdate ABC transporter substrate-binding protein [Pseudomonadota bacterium]